MGVTLKQFEQMKERVGGRKPVAAPLFAASGQMSTDAPQVILGIDPSLRGTGYGVIRVVKRQPQALCIARGR